MSKDEITETSRSCTSFKFVGFTLTSYRSSTIPSIPSASSLTAYMTEIDTISTKTRNSNT